jgi:hypothetical protein
LQDGVPFEAFANEVVDVFEQEQHKQHKHHNHKSDDEWPDERFE